MHARAHIIGIPGGRICNIHIMVGVFGKNFEHLEPL